MTFLLAAGPQGPTTEITGTTVFYRWQYEIILYALVVAFFALFASGVYSISTRQEISKKYRTATQASALITWVAALAYLALIVVWLTRWTSADGVRYAAKPGTVFTGLRYADWSVTVPLLTVELLAVCTLSRAQAFRTRFAAIAAAFLMILTGFFGVIAVGQSSASTTELVVWGLISTVFFIALYPLLIGPMRATLKVVGTEAGTSLRNATVLLLSIWGVYPLVYLIAWWSKDGSTGWATTTQLAFTAADIIAKVGFGVLVHKVAKLRTAEDATEESASVPDTYPAEVYISGELMSVPNVAAVHGSAYPDQRVLGNGAGRAARPGATGTVR